jgi:hypothetical protein
MTKAIINIATPPGIAVHDHIIVGGNGHASLKAAQGRREDARALLQAVYDRFDEGLDTADLKSAARLLAGLR